MTTFFGFLLLAALLGLVAWLQRRADRAGDDDARERIAEARRTGAHTPLMQHPQIDLVQCIGCGSCARVCPEGDVLGVVEGKATIINGAACIGHGRCAEACPVGAITVGLGELARRDDIPTLDERQESTVPGLFLVGEVTGIALIRHAIAHGIAAVDTIAARTPGRAGAGAAAADDGVLDVAIVGAGPAGLAAALKAIECGLSHTLLDQDEAGGTILHYPRQKLVMTQPVRLPLYGDLTESEYTKEALVQVWNESLERFPVRFRSGARLTGIDRHDGLFQLTTTAGTCTSRNVVLALGRRGTPRKLGVPGEELEKVSYRLVDAGLYRDQDLLVVGGGDSAVEAALGLAEQPGNRVTLSYRKDSFFRLKPRNRVRLEEASRAGRLRLALATQVREIGSDTVTLTSTSESGTSEAGSSEAGSSTTSIANDFVFVFAGAIPPVDLLRQAGVTFGGQQGDQRGETTVKSKPDRSNVPPG